jgi:beta-lactamase superfamily II metal-dependent hydrolase
MRLEILNVEHGFCAFAVGTAGDVFLFDCGLGPSCRPSSYLPARGIRSIQRFFVTNYDEDHIEDLPALRRALSIELLSKNPSLDARIVRSLKQPPISPAMQEMLSMLDSYTGVVAPEQLDPPGLRAVSYSNPYPRFTDTNNLSLLTFLDVGSVTFAIPGDLEREGWLLLLQNPEVRDELRRVDVFIASHHGRESGYCGEVFNYCAPEFIVLSDGAIEFDSQRMASTYARHASGGAFNGPGGREVRRVLSTRSDGNLCWEL